MSGFSSFTFGVPNYFSFTFSFQLGRPSHDPVALVPQDLGKTTAKKLQRMYIKPTVKTASNSSRKAVTQPNSEIVPKPACHVATKASVATVIEATDEPVLPEFSVTLQKRCPLLYAIPLEIRFIIYDHLLVSASSISTKQANKLLGGKRSILLSDHNPISDISATLLRTCRKVYNEALPILYGRNVFSFPNPEAIEKFRDRGIDGWSRVPNYGPRQPQGRLTFLRSVILRFDPNESYMVSQLGGDPDPKSTWTEWTEQSLNSRLHDLRFPSLKELTLDFLKMKVDENEGFRVEPFIRRLAPSEGLQKLVIRGLKHEDTLEGFRAGLVKTEGYFVVENPST